MKTTKKVGKNDSKKTAKKAKRTYSKRFDIAEMQDRVLSILEVRAKQTGGTPMSLTALGRELRIKGSPSNVYQRLSRVLKPMRGQSIDWKRGKGQGIVLLKGASARTLAKLAVSSFYGKTETSYGSNGSNGVHSQALVFLQDQLARAQQEVERLSQAITVLGGV